MNAALAVSKISESDFSSQLNQVFEDMPGELYSVLNEAHDRYLHLVGITAGNFPTSTLENDKERFGGFVKQGESGSPIFDDDDCSQFMASVYAIPKLLCRMFIANDFNWTAASGFVEDNSAIDESNQALGEHLKNTEALREVIEFLISRGVLIETPPSAPN